MNKSYTQSAYYHIGLVARYMKIFGEQIFEKINLGISFDEFIVLDIISTEGPMCQRDLAKLIIKDRANTGRIANSLKNNKLIEIKMDKKNNRLVNILTVTSDGTKMLNAIIEKIRPILEEIEKEYTDEQAENFISMLKKCQELMKKIVDIQI